MKKQDSSTNKSPKILREFSKYSIILGGFGVKYAVEKSSDKKFKLSKNVDIENISEDDLEKLVNKK